MIVCPNCSSEIFTTPTCYICNKCNKEYPVADGVVFFADNSCKTDDSLNDKYKVEIDKIYKSERTHFWFSARSALIVDVFKKYVSTSSSILEIGSGTGFVAEKLIENEYNVSLSDYYSTGIGYLKDLAIFKSIYQFDIMHPPFIEHFDVVCLFDVLEHIGNDFECLQKIGKILKIGGKVVLTVPAHMLLWSDEDVLSQHFRRYSKKELESLFISSGFKISFSSSFFISILPLLFLRKFFKVKKNEEITPLNKITNYILKTISIAENKLLMKIPINVGGSIIIVAEKI